MKWGSYPSLIRSSNTSSHTHPIVSLILHFSLDQKLKSKTTKDDKPEELIPSETDASATTNLNNETQSEVPNQVESHQTTEVPTIISNDNSKMEAEQIETAVTETTINDGNQLHLLYVD
jgi:hypothetical protein